jgi:hypothetical protein
MKEFFIVALDSTGGRSHRVMAENEREAWEKYEDELACNDDHGAAVYRRTELRRLLIKLKASLEAGRG